MTLTTWLRISIDGWDEQSYARYRRVDTDEFTKVLRNMADFKKLGGKCYLGVSIVVDQDNAAHVYDLTHRLKDIGVDSVKVSPCVISNDGAQNNRYHQPFFAQAKQQVAKALADFAGDDFEIFDAYHDLEETYSYCEY